VSYTINNAFKTICQKNPIFVQSYGKKLRTFIVFLLRLLANQTNYSPSRFNFRSVMLFIPHNSFIGKNTRITSKLKYIYININK